MTMQRKKIIQFIGSLFFGFLFYLALVYYKERMLSFDPAYYSFLLLQQKAYNFSNGRWISYITEIVPVIALKNNCSIVIFLKLYSVMFILVYYAIFLLCTLLFNNYKAGLALMLSLSLGFRWIFYYATTELFMGIALTILLWAIIGSANFNSPRLKKWISTLLSLFLIYTISYCHQLTFFMVLFVVLLEIISENRYKDKHLLAIFAFTIIWYFIRVKFLTTSDYEKDKLNIIETSINYINDFTNLPYWMHLKSFFFMSLKPLCITFLFCLILAAIYRKWILLAFSILFMTGYVIFTVMIFPEGSNNLFYETYYTPFGLITGILLIALIYNRFPFAVTIFITLFLLVLNLNGIYMSHNIQSERIKYLDRLTAYGRQKENKKYLLNVANIPMNIVSVQGYLPFESLIYSSLHSKDSSVTFFWTFNMNQYDSLINNENIFLGPDFAPTRFRTDLLNKQYYHLPSGNYLKVNNSQSDSSFKESFFNNKNVEIIPTMREVSSSNDNFIIMPIRIHNISGKTINSTPDGKNPVYLSYHLYDKNSKLLTWDNSLTTLEVDISDDYTQGLFVDLPSDKGNYIIETDFVTENIRWWNINCRFKLTVK